MRGSPWYGLPSMILWICKIRLHLYPDTFLTSFLGILDDGGGSTGQGEVIDPEAAVALRTHRVKICSAAVVKFIYNIKFSSSGTNILKMGCLCSKKQNADGGADGNEPAAASPSQDAGAASTTGSGAPAPANADEG
ncbi:unnamed protein product [Allacma fusca]|uniref:Uncharacterized protein n=1 Tax=Allacma fusca TaxID=39272 RepID=A0A8J2LQW3_9HEXA|nr:unnamed protein product [Allacma fusca]